VCRLIKAGANVNLQDRQWRTPLHYLYALNSDRDSEVALELVRLLLDASANIHPIDLLGQTVFHTAAKNHIRLVVVRLLLSWFRKADFVLHYNNEGYSALDVAVRRGDNYLYKPYKS
jgi:hypothetical protein